jgi:hypothetical protein
MGYLSLGEFSAIEAYGTSWFNRLPLTTGVLLENGDLLEKLLKIRRQSIYGLGLVVDEQGKKCGLIAVRAPSVTRKPVKTARKSARKASFATHGT